MVKLSVVVLVLWARRGESVWGGPALGSGAWGCAGGGCKGGTQPLTTHVVCYANVRLVGCGSACTGKSFVVTMFVSTVFYPLAHYGSTGRQSWVSLLGIPWVVESVSAQYWVISQTPHATHPLPLTPHHWQQAGSNRKACPCSVSVATCQPQCAFTTC